MTGIADVDFVAEATIVKELAAEYQALKTRMEEIKAELKARRAAMERGVEAVTGLHPSSSRKRVVKNPRPVNDKLSIAAGRAINIAWKKKKSPDVCKAEGIAAAAKAAKKYGMEKVPADILKLIDKKIKVRFNL